MGDAGDEHDEESLGDGPETGHERPRRAVPDPLDRLWMHPSELSAFVGPSSASPPRHRPMWTATLVAGAAAAVIVAPWAGVLVALLVLLVLFFPPARAVLTLAPPVLLGLAALYIAGKQQRYELPPVFEWPTLFPRAETPAWLAMVLVAADGWIEWLRTRYPAPNDLSEQGEPSDAAA